MELRAASIFNFGKLQQKEYKFAPGINVIYGENEAGKSTLHAFLMAMLFGMEKGRGRSIREDYARYEPWHAPSYYSGALRFSVEERPFYLERNFYHREKREILRNEADGEELSVAYGDLAMLLGGIDKETFGNTYDIPQSGAVSGRELTGILAEYLSDAAGGGVGGIHAARAVDALNRKKKEFTAELKKIQSEKEQTKAALRLEEELLGQDCARLEQEIAAEQRERAQAGKHFAIEFEKAKQELEQSEVRLENERRIVARLAQEKEKQGQAEERQKRGEKALRGENKRAWRLAIFSGLSFAMAMLLGWGIHRGGIYQGVFFWLMEGSLVLAAVLSFIAAVICGRQKEAHGTDTQDEGQGAGSADRATEAAGEPGAGNPEEREESEDQWREAARQRIEMAALQAEAARRHMETIQAQAESAKQQVERVLARMQESLQEKESRRCNIEEQFEELEEVSARERELGADIDAVTLAAEEIARLAREFGEEMEDALNSEISRYVSAITAGKYDSVRVSDRGGLLVLADGKEAVLDVLSRGTLEQFYLAFRLAVGNIVTREERMPLFLDEIFGMYDDVRLEETLRMLAELDNQILIFTCQRREMELLERMGITYHRVEML